MIALLVLWTGLQLWYLANAQRARIRGPNVVHASSLQKPLTVDEVIDLAKRASRASSVWSTKRAGRASFDLDNDDWPQTVTTTEVQGLPDRRVDVRLTA